MNKSQLQNNEQNPRHIVDIGGLAGNSENRNISALKAIYAKATNSCSWTEDENVRQVTLLFTAPLATTTDVSYPMAHYVRMVVDALTEAVADAWFNEVGGVAVPIEFDKLPYNVPIQITFASYVSDLHFDPTIDNTNVIITAAGVDRV